MAVLGHSDVQRANAPDFSNALRSATLLRPRTGALRPNLVFTPMRIFRQALMKWQREKGRILRLPPERGCVEDQPQQLEQT